ncbi:hypothetical protein B0H14DRAFT_3123807 [Mycena olivaceomarginata]|nr:hypothetical protein B0H14DRAFT_3123807 [Mycena olivaceomarginata]
MKQLSETNQTRLRTTPSSQLKYQVLFVSSSNPIKSYLSRGVRDPINPLQKLKLLKLTVPWNPRHTRQVYLKHPDGDFWDQLDDRLDEIRNEAKKLTRGFHHVLTQDQDKHGAKDYVLDETTVDDFQQQVDDIIAVDTATSTASVQDSTA